MQVVSYRIRHSFHRRSTRLPMTLPRPCGPLGQLPGKAGKSRAKHRVQFRAWFCDTMTTSEES